MKSNAVMENIVAERARKLDHFRIYAPSIILDKAYTVRFLSKLSEAYDSFHSEASAIDAKGLPWKVRLCFNGISERIKRPREKIEAAKSDGKNEETLVLGLRERNGENVNLEMKTNALKELVGSYGININNSKPSLRDIDDASEGDR